MISAITHQTKYTLRSILDLHGYTLKERQSNAEKFVRISKFLTEQGFNVGFSLIGLMHKPRLWNRKNIKKYIEIFIKSDTKKIMSVNKKQLYKNKKNIVGFDIKPQFPKNPHIIIDNTFDKNLNTLALVLRSKIRKLIIKKKYASWFF